MNYLFSERPLKKFLHKYFGKHWGFIVIIYLLILFFPLILFYSSLAFDPASFTSDWIKTGITSLIVYFFVKFIVESQEIRDKIKSYNNAFNERLTILLKIHDVIDRKINNKEIDLGKTQPNKLWKKFIKLFNPDKLTNETEEVEIFLGSIILNSNVDKYQNIFLNLVQCQDQDFDKKEAEELNVFINYLIIEMEKTKHFHMRKIR